MPSISESEIVCPARLPGLTNELVTSIVKANPNTVVVNQSGTPVEFPWIDSADTVLQVRSQVLFYS